MSKSNDLFSIQDICQYFGLSEQTIRRRIRESREGTGSFPKPIFGYGKRGLWHREQIENWKETQEQSGQEG